MVGDFSHAEQLIQTAGIGVKDGLGDLKPPPGVGEDHFKDFDFDAMKTSFDQNFKNDIAAAVQGSDKMNFNVDDMFNDMKQFEQKAQNCKADCAFDMGTMPEGFITGPPGAKADGPGTVIQGGDKQQQPEGINQPGMDAIIGQDIPGGGQVTPDLNQNNPDLINQGGQPPGVGSTSCQQLGTLDRGPEEILRCRSSDGILGPFFKNLVFIYSYDICVVAFALFLNPLSSGDSQCSFAPSRPIWQLYRAFCSSFCVSSHYMDFSFRAPQRNRDFGKISRGSDKSLYSAR